MLAFASYGIAGDPPVVLLHGWPLDRSLWAAVASDLVAVGYRVVCPDLPGFGASPPLAPDDWTVEAYADEVAALLVSLGSGPVPVAGHSFGGYVALALADDHADLLAGLGLIASRTSADSDTARAGREATIAQVRAQGTRALLPGLAAKLLAPTAAPELRLRAERLVGACPPEAVLAGLAAMVARPDRGFVLEEFARPLLVVHGTSDQIIPAAEAANPSRSRGVTRRLLEGIGHLPMWEAVSETAGAVAAWAHATRGP